MNDEIETHDQLSYDPDRLPSAVTTNDIYARALLTEMRGFRRDLHTINRALTDLTHAIKQLRVTTAKDRRT